MFTDIVGYTKLCQENEVRAIQLLEDHALLVRPIVQVHEGTEIKTIGDAFMIVFSSAMDAVLCAIQIQAHMADRNERVSEKEKLHLRIGIHLGDVFKRAGDNDLYGDGVNVASRVVNLAVGDSIFFTQQIYDQIQKQIESPIIDLGMKQVKNVLAPLHVYKIGTEAEAAGRQLKQAISEEDMQTAFIEAPAVVLDRRAGEERRDPNNAPVDHLRAPLVDRRDPRNRRQGTEQSRKRVSLLFSPPPRRSAHANYISNLSARERFLLGLLAVTSLLGGFSFGVNHMPNNPVTVAANDMSEYGAARRIANEQPPARPNAPDCTASPQSCVSHAILFEKSGSYTEAAVLYGAACDARSGQACMALSRMYGTGLGLTASRVMADGYMMKACRSGDPEACTKIKSGLSLVDH
ncbi:MAG: hypothetical protein HY074_14485 [Deltaproteobacteria bacterium]|nr:hypothetical protein [Deltaproteobacteria bacterium]